MQDLQVMLRGLGKLRQKTINHKRTINVHQEYMYIYIFVAGGRGTLTIGTMVISAEGVRKSL